MLRPPALAASGRAPPPPPAAAFAVARGRRRGPAPAAVTAREFISECAASLGETRFIVVGDGAILETVAPFAGVRFSDVAGKPYATIGPADRRFECHINMAKARRPPPPLLLRLGCASLPPPAALLACCAAALPPPAALLVCIAAADPADPADPAPRPPPPVR